MNLNNFTIKAAEAIQQAQQLAFNAQNPSIETEHILKALLNDKDSPVEYLLKKNNVNVNYVEEKLETTIQKLPKVTNGEPAHALSRDANNVLLRANASLKTFKDTACSGVDLSILNLVILPVGEKPSLTVATSPTVIIALDFSIIGIFKISSIVFN